jgi:phosphoribosylformimino-5-aminoimidazole carboxamide ribotide isomerase
MDTATLDVAREASRRFGERVAALLTVKDGCVTVDEGLENASGDPITMGKALAACGIRRIVYTDLMRDGTLAGPDTSALEAFVRAVAVPVIAAGGITSLADLTALARIGMEAVVVGRALYEGWLDLRGLEQRLHIAQENRRA